MDASFPPFFERLTGRAPHAWQAQLGAATACPDRLIRVPTGFGKTAGVVMPWLFHRVVRGDRRWPTRLVLVLPMRVLVEQIFKEIGGWLSQAGLTADVGLHLLMGGVDAGDFISRPERPAVLVGTQDMLLSRALNRGFAAGRARWPIDFGLLHEDALWVLDEVQLMDVGLATTAQLAAFRRQHAGVRPCATWWMSATLQPSWLSTVDHAARVPALVEGRTAIPPEARSGGLWEVAKTLTRRADIGTPDEVAALALELHEVGRVTLVIVNTVDKALTTHDAIAKTLKKRKGDGPELRLVHSRFRGAERVAWVADFLRRDAPLPDAGRIIVATQVVEAGVDISAAALVAELAPWSSLVQRFGRAARYVGEAGRIAVFGAVPSDANKALPYREDELTAASLALERLGDDASPRGLERFEDRLASEDPGFLATLYPYSPIHVVRRVDLDDLFDTSPDLSGADLDPSRYIRSGEDRDIAVFWRDLPKDAPVTIDAGEFEPPRREELCPVPVHQARKWLASIDAWALDYLQNEWRPVDPSRLYAGMQVLVANASGGYDTERGFDPKATGTTAVPLREVDVSVEHFERAAAGADSEELSYAAWKTIGTHGSEAGKEAEAIGAALELDEATRRVLVLAAVWHDLGKVHPEFQRAILPDRRIAAGMTERGDLAKAPDGAWRKPRPYPQRPGFRHEFASMLALFALRAEHPALRTLDDDAFDLLAWLVVSHHGKVRCRLTPTPHDQAKGAGAIFGVIEGETLPALTLVDERGQDVEVTAATLSLELASIGESERFGASWIERVTRLLSRHGPFTLAYLEALVRAADVRATLLATKDTRL